MDTAPRILQTEHSALGVGCRDWDARSERVALSAKAGVAYAVTVLAIGFQLGTASVLLLAACSTRRLDDSRFGRVAHHCDGELVRIEHLDSRAPEIRSVGSYATLADRSRENGTEVSAVRGMHQAPPLGRTHDKARNHLTQTRTDTSRTAEIASSNCLLVVETIRSAGDRPS